jgi:hypothetical protein
MPNPAVGRDRRILAEVADRDGPRAAGSVDQLEFLAADHLRRIADRRIFPHAAPEAPAAGGRLLDLAEQVHAGHRPGTARFLCPLIHLGNHPDQRGAMALDRDELADRGTIRASRKRVRKTDAGLGTLDREDTPEAGLGGDEAESFCATMLDRHRSLHDLSARNALATRLSCHRPVAAR